MKLPSAEEAAVNIPLMDPEPVETENRLLSGEMVMVFGEMDAVPDSCDGITPDRSESGEQRASTLPLKLNPVILPSRETKKEALLPLKPVMVHVPAMSAHFDGASIAVKTLPVESTPAIERDFLVGEKL